MLSLLQTLCSSTSPGHLQRDETGASSGLNWPTFIRVCKQHMIDTSHSFVKFQDCIRLGQCGAQEFSKTPAPAATVFSAWAPCLSPQPALHALTKSNSTTLAVQAAHASAAASFRAVASTAVSRLAARASRHLLLGPVLQGAPDRLRPPSSPSAFIAKNARAIAMRMERLHLRAMRVQWHHILSSPASTPHHCGTGTPLYPLTHTPLHTTGESTAAASGAHAIHHWQQAHSGGVPSHTPSTSAPGQGATVVPGAVRRAMRAGHHSTSMYGTRRDMNPASAAAAGLPFEVEGVFVPSAHPSPVLLRTVHAAHQLCLSEGVADYMGSTQLPSSPPLTVYCFEATGGYSLASCMHTLVPAVCDAPSPSREWVSAVMAMQDHKAAAAASMDQSQLPVSNAPLAALRVSSLGLSRGEDGASAQRGGAMLPVGGLCETQPLFRHIMNCVVRTLRDVQTMCSYSITRPLTSENVFLADGGSRVLLGHIPWGPAVSDDVSQLKRRADMLLASVGAIAREILCLDALAPPPASRVYTAAGAERGVALRCGESAVISLPWGPGRVWSTASVHSRIAPAPVSLGEWRLFDEAGDELPVPWKAGEDTWDVVSAAVASMETPPALGLLSLAAHERSSGSSTLVLYEHACGEGLPAAPAMSCHITTHSAKPSAVLTALLQACDAATRRCGVSPQGGRAGGIGSRDNAEQLLGVRRHSDWGGLQDSKAEQASPDVAVLHVGSLAAHPYFAADAVQLEDACDDYMRHFHVPSQVAAASTAM